MKIVDNSFYHQNLQGIKVLILAPHQDDEINIAGNSIKNFNDLGAEVHVCFSTNGDFIVPASVRISEAVNALMVLGCSVEHIHFLGYGDSLNNNPQGHIFYSQEGVVTSMAEHEETYAACGYSDFSFQYQNKHSQYNSKCFHKDLKHLIIELKPDVIICVDLDTHADHRMLSLAFDKVMGEILNEKKNYHPTVLKRFAYCLAYFADNDFYQINLQQNKKPMVGREKNYSQVLIDTAYYQWSSRVRMPVISGEYSTFLFSKTLTKALKCHQSQSAVMHAGQIINGDEVFFRRRTDSISYVAEIETSSGNGRYLNDFRILGLNDIDSMVMQYANYLWQPDRNDKSKQATFRWKKPQKISKAIIYGNVTDKGQIKKLKIHFDNGYEFISGVLPENGTPLEIDFEPQENISFCTIQILDFEGEEYGIAECEFYNDIQIESVLSPFIKILIDDDFVYEYLIDTGVKQLPLKIYKSIKEMDTVFKIVSGDAYILGGILYFKNNNDILVRLENDDSSIYDQVYIRRVSKFRIKVLAFIKKIESNLTIIYFRALRKLNYFKTNGIYKGIQSIINK